MVRRNRNSIEVKLIPAAITRVTMQVVSRRFHSSGGWMRLIWTSPGLTELAGCPTLNSVFRIGNTLE
jgi:hypothetical protein